MSGKIEQARSKVNREVHQALDSVLPQLEFDEIVGLLESLRTLSASPHMLLRAFAFVSDVIEPARAIDGPARTRPRRAAANGSAASGSVLNLVGEGHGKLLSRHEAERRLAAVAETVAPEAWAGSELASPTELKTRLGVSRSTLNNWRSHGRVVALRKGLRNHVYPLRQFQGAAPIEGLGAIIAAHVSAEEAWDWLISPNSATNDEAPLEVLRRGDIGLVLRAADGEVDYA